MSLRPAIVLAATLVAMPSWVHATEDYAYAWPLQTSDDSAAWQVELTPEVYAVVTRADLRDVAVLNAAGDPVPMAERSDAATTGRETLAVLPLFALPAETATGKGDDTIRLRVERGADGRLRSIDTPPGWKSPIRFLSSAIGEEFGTIESKGFEGPGPAVSPCEPVMSSQELIEEILLDAVRACGLVDVRFSVEATPPRSP